MSELDHVIPPEITNDEFSHLINRLAADPTVRTVLEIGSSAGGGSTEAFVAGLDQNPSQPRLFCMEVSQPRFEALAKRYAGKSFVRCYNTSSVPLAKFPSHDEVVRFYQERRTALNQFPLPQVLGWLDQDIAYVRDSGHDEDGIARIKADNRIATFDLVLIDGSEFTGQAELDAVDGARIILLDDIATFKNRVNYERLSRDARYRLIAENWQLRNGFAAFQRLDVDMPIHFFTIVLNGEPFIRHHWGEFNTLQVPWHWHIVEGVADLRHDTAWSVPQGGRIDEAFHRDGLSNDGTTEYLDQLARDHPDRISLYRKPRGQFWDGKLEMVNAPLASITVPGLLWQVDVDELWRAEQITSVHTAFQQHPEKTSAFFHCHYYIAPGLVTVTPEAYSHHNAWEWLRVWRFAPGMRWFSHEPPALGRNTGTEWIDVGRERPFSHAETESLGAVFTHPAYVLESQVRFKELYYGYAGAVEHWRRFCAATETPRSLGAYLPWVRDTAMADCLEASPFGSRVPPVPFVTGRTRIVLDGVFFQLNSSGIARVWMEVLSEWSRSPFAGDVIVLDRNGTAPKLPGLTYAPFPLFDPAQWEEERNRLDEVCHAERADIFISTYYTAPRETPSVFMAYDMIPEVFGADLSHWEWRLKHAGIASGSAAIAISANTASDLQRFFPDYILRGVTVAHCGVGKEFRRSNPADIEAFRQRTGLTRPYYLYIGARDNYKNARLLFRAVGSMTGPSAPMILCVGGGPSLSPELAGLVPRDRVVITSLTDRDLRHAYSGAEALVFPSRYEGFGLPIVEAQAMGTPVITCRNSSILEVAGEAAMFVPEDDPGVVVFAMDQLRDPVIRSALINAGLANASRFTWKAMAAAMYATLESVARESTTAPAAGALVS